MKNKGAKALLNKLFAQVSVLKKSYPCILAVAALFVSACFGEKVHLESYATNPDSIPIGIMPFSAQSDAAIKSSEPWMVIADDLDFSGKFLVVRGQKGDSLVFAQKNVAIYITGRYMMRGSLVAVDCFLRDANHMKNWWKSTIMAKLNLCAV